MLKGGPTAEAYALIRRAQLAVQQALETELDLELRFEVNAALTGLNQSEDAIVRAHRLRT